ncbi:MAG: hypothetical protein ACI4VU_07265 [Methanobrevibacter sp.]
MPSNDISNVVLFKRQNDDYYEFDDKYVGLKMLDNNVFVFSIEAPQEEVGKSMMFFENIAMFEPILVDIGGTGNIPCYFKGVSPVVGKGPMMNGTHKNAFYTVTLQELVNAPPDVEEEHECVGCGFHNFTCDDL